MQIRCKEEKQNLTLIACSVPDSVLGTFPVLSHVSLTNLARHVLQPHLTNRETGGSEIFNTLLKLTELARNGIGPKQNLSDFTALHVAPGYDLGQTLLF